jgi:RHS repeat-associated protein
VQAGRYDAFGTPEGLPDDRSEHLEYRRGPEREGPGSPGGDHGSRGWPELPRFGYRGELAHGPMVYLRSRIYDSQLGRFTTPDPLASQPRQVPAISPYVYAGNDPLNATDPLGLFSFGSIVSSVVHAAAHIVHGVQHAVHAVTGTVTRGAHILAGGIAHAFHDVHTVLVHVADTARKDAARLAHIVRDAATHAVHAVSDAVSASVGVVKSTVNQAITWIKKHNEIIGKIGSVLSNVAGGLALAGLVIAPIPGLDFLTPVLEGAAAAAAIGALAAQSVARAAGDRNITYGDLLGDALGAIPGGEDVEDAEQGINVASHLTEGAADDAGAGGALRFTQNTASATFKKGPFAGRTIGDIADALHNGDIKPSELPVGVNTRGDNQLILNTRSSLALLRGGIGPDDWAIKDLTGDPFFESVLNKRLASNGLTNEGTEVLRITGAGRWASWLG